MQTQSVIEKPVARGAQGQQYTKTQCKGITVSNHSGSAWSYIYDGVTETERQSDPHLPPREDMPFTNSFSSMSPELSVSYVCKGEDGDKFELAESHPSQQTSMAFAAAQQVAVIRGTGMGAQTQCRLRL